MRIDGAIGRPRRQPATAQTPVALLGKGPSHLENVAKVPPTQILSDDQIALLDLGHPRQLLAIHDRFERCAAVVVRCIGRVGFGVVGQFLLQSQQGALPGVLLDALLFRHFLAVAIVVAARGTVSGVAARASFAGGAHAISTLRSATGATLLFSGGGGGRGGAGGSVGCSDVFLTRPAAATGRCAACAAAIAAAVHPLTSLTIATVALLLFELLLGMGKLLLLLLVHRVSLLLLMLILLGIIGRTIHLLLVHRVPLLLLLPFLTIL
mmetsp:Transcript_5633/g.10304  ORF Transcript_5633/g.10304 Transcript_5633/m.10304 type:complete len:266 (+) Transcript_5633:1478-2275(+)